MQTMKQTTLATAGFAAFSKTTRKEAFLKRCAPNQSAYRACHAVASQNLDAKT